MWIKAYFSIVGCNNNVTKFKVQTTIPIQPHKLWVPKEPFWELIKIEPFESAVLVQTQMIQSERHDFWIGWSQGTNINPLIGIYRWRRRGELDGGVLCVGVRTFQAQVLVVLITRKPEGLGLDFDILFKSMQSEI